MNRTTKTIMNSVAKTALLLVVVVGTLALTTGCDEHGGPDNVGEYLTWEWLGYYL